MLLTITLLAHCTALNKYYAHFIQSLEDPTLVFTGYSQERDSYKYKLWRLVESTPFEYFIMTLIVLNTILLMLKVRPSLPSHLTVPWEAGSDTSINPMFKL